MPRYDYECDGCGVMEIEHRMGETLTVCPKCGQALRQIFSVPGVKFNGGGWTPRYHTRATGSTTDVSQ